MQLTFRLSDDISWIRPAFEREQERILDALPGAEVIHTGATSLSGLLTLGDLDIHVRVMASRFEPASSALEKIYSPHRPQMWTPGFRAYLRLSRRLPIGVALSAIGSEHDLRFRRGWARLAGDPRLIAEYNQIKLRHAGGDQATYEADKADFFTRLAEGA